MAKNSYGDILISKRAIMDILQQAGAQNFMHLWIVVDANGELEPTPFGGRTDIAPQTNLFVLLNTKVTPVETLYYAFWMLVQNRDGYAIERDM